VFRLIIYPCSSVINGYHKTIEKSNLEKMNGIKKIVIVSLMHPSGSTGVQTHVNTFAAYLHSISQPWQLVTPFNAPKFLLYPLLVLRRLIEPIFPAASVWLYRKGHAWLLGLALKRILNINPNAAIYAQCPVSANIALAKRRSASQQVTLVVHFNISQAEEWAGKDMISQRGTIYQGIVDFEGHVIPLVDKLVFVSVYMQKQIQERIPSIVSVDQQVIPNFVTDPMPQNHTDIDADLIAIGTLEPRKNQTYLLDIIAAAKVLGKQITLTLVGDGPDRAMLENKTKKLGISDQIYFKGFIPNGSFLMARHQACIHVAKIENLPVTLIEALAYGKPIFAGAVGGIPEVFDDNVQGRIIPLDNEKDAAKIIVATLQNQTLVAKFGASARHQFLSSFEQNLLSKRLREFILSPAKVN
jgi:glycosyltransferase involved in cell wall biosynthesis